MATDPWGVDSGYVDSGSQWHDTSPETHGAILAAMGVEDATTVAGGPEPVRVLHEGQGAVWPQRGLLRLEDGTTLAIDGRLPPDLPLGYHDFQAEGQTATTRVIVAPSTCLLPDRALWGWAVQLYAARSAASWGIGDLADLRRLGRWSAGLGAGLLLINPLYAPAPVLPQEPSPYYPSSRRFLNPLYLRIEEVPGAGDLGDELEPLAAAARALNATRRIDRDAVFRHKQSALRCLWDRFAGSPEFAAYRRRQGDALEQFATYCALAERHGGDWRAWPAEYRDPGGPAVRRFAESRAREVEYHQWIQWLLDGQLADAARALPLVGDLPIGASPAGADAWQWQHLLAGRATVGAPPDAFNTRGQDWSMPPFAPHKLRAAGYEPFIQMLRAALRHAAGLRIDHVMGLFRLWWIPAGFGPKRGAYVRYRADEFLAIVALESRRAGAFVVGEDLGTVEPQTRQKLAEHQVLSFRVLWFEHGPPERYPRLAMAAITTHDLPTVAGLWSGQDEAARESIGLDRTAAAEDVRRRFGQLAQVRDDAPPGEVIEAAHRVLGRAPSLVLVATLEDAMALPDRPNMPGTTTQWPNWSQALPGGLNALETSEMPRRIARALVRSPP